MLNSGYKLQKILGLSDKETAIYISLLELGQATVMDIAQKTGIKRTTVYHLLPPMQRKGYIKAMYQNKKHLFFVDDVKSLKNRLQDKQASLDKLIPQLQAIHNLLPSKPKITYYEGEGGMKELYWDTLNSSQAGAEICAYTGMANFYQVIPTDFVDEYIDQRVKRKIPIKVIAPSSPAARDWVKNASHKLREIKLIDDPSLGFNADMEIYADKVALITYMPDFVGVIIRSKELNQLLKSAFMIMWKNLPSLPTTR